MMTRGKAESLIDFLPSVQGEPEPRLPVKATPHPEWLRKPAPVLTAAEVRRLMRLHGKTIRGFAAETGITMKRIRRVRAEGLACPFAARDWMQAMTGMDPGPM